LVAMPTDARAFIERTRAIRLCISNSQLEEEEIQCCYIRVNRGRVRYIPEVELFGGLPARHSTFGALRASLNVANH
jgi:hypothetical protein